MINRIGDRLELDRDGDDWVLRLLNVAAYTRVDNRPTGSAVCHVENPTDEMRHGGAFDAAELHLTTYDLWRIVEVIEQAMYGDKDVPGRLTMPPGALPSRIPGSEP